MIVFPSSLTVAHRMKLQSEPMLTGGSPQRSMEIERRKAATRKQNHQVATHKRRRSEVWNEWYAYAYYGEGNRQLLSLGSLPDRRVRA